MRRGSSGISQAEPERLQKVLARLGLASRREAEEWIRAGRVSVNGQVATLGVRVKPTDQLRLDGRPIRQRAPSAPQVFVVHRSPGQNLTPQEGDPRHEPAHETENEDSERSAARARPSRSRFEDAGEQSDASVLERLPRRAGRRFIVVSPMPRIDGGLELVTSDGELASRLQRAAHRLSSEFSVRVRGELSETQHLGILEGQLDRGARLEVEQCEAGGGEGANRWYTVTVRGGSGKDVRQLFERQGVVVSRVLRTRIGPLSLSRDLARGHFRRLESKELETLIASVSNTPASTSEPPVMPHPRPRKKRPVRRASR